MSGNNGGRFNLDAFTSIDNKLSKVNDHLRELRSQSQKIDQLISALNSIPGSPGVAEGRVAHLDMSTSVPANTDAEDELVVTEPIPFEGRITGFVVGFNTGSQGAAGVRFDVENANGGTVHDVFPYNDSSGHFGVDGFNEKMSAGFDVEGNHIIKAGFVNYDTTNSHYVALSPIIREKI